MNGCDDASIYPAVSVRYVGNMRECTTCGTRGTSDKCSGCGFTANIPRPGWYVFHGAELWLGPFMTHRQAWRRA